MHLSYYFGRLGRTPEDIAIMTIRAGIEYNRGRQPDNQARARVTTARDVS
jgi:hypothetical protein